MRPATRERRRVAPMMEVLETAAASRERTAVVDPRETLQGHRREPTAVTVQGRRHRHSSQSSESASSRLQRLLIIVAVLASQVGACDAGTYSCCPSAPERHNWSSPSPSMSWQWACQEVEGAFESIGGEEEPGASAGANLYQPSVSPLCPFRTKLCDACGPRPKAPLVPPPFLRGILTGSPQHRQRGPVCPVCRAPEQEWSWSLPQAQATAAASSAGQ